MDYRNETNPPAEPEAAEKVSRRVLLGGAGAVAASLGMGLTGLAGAQEHVHQGTGGDRGLIGAAIHCIEEGEICLDHCMDTFQAGDLELATCARVVNELSIACTALAKLAAHGSNHLKAMARVTVAVCRDCKTECLKHAQHPECLECAASCDPCVEECEKLLV